ncbi:MAG: hypothetical protein FH761_14355 [Firmicutes bacterium]|nr:hypothetical protein [Bacillota bacterium]
MNDKRYLFYPYSNDSYGFIRGLISLNIDFDVISPDGYGLIGKDVGYAINGKDIGKKVKGFNGVNFSDYDAIIISEDISESNKSELTKIIEKSKKNNLEILNYNDDAEYEKELILRKSMKRYDKFSLPFYTPEKLIILVGGIVETIDNFYVSLQTKIGLEKMGYRVEMITNSNDGRFFGCIKYPKEFMSSKISSEEQIHKLNKYIRGIEDEINPHIIIMDIPKGMIKYDKYYDNSFGMYTFMIGQSVRPDYLIVNTLNNYINEEYFNKLSDYFEVILGKRVDIFNISNSFFENDSTVKSMLEKPMYLKYDNLQKIPALFEKMNFKVECLYEQKRVDSMVKELIGNFT